MVRKNFMVTNRHAEQLKKEAKKLDISMSEVLRQAITLYFAVKANKKPEISI